MNSKVIEFSHPRRSREVVREQACAWLARLDIGTSLEDLHELDAWLDADPRNVRMLLSMAAMWDQSKVLAELSDVFPLEDNARPIDSPRRRVIAAALASTVIFGGVALAVGVIDFRQAPLIANQLHETAVGERRQVELPDGSEVTLNTNTRLRVAFDGHDRALYLERGEAFFNVSQDAKRPFRVHVDSHLVEAVGTAFTVLHTESSDLEILVTEGKVNYRELRTEPETITSIEKLTGAPGTMLGLKNRHTIPLEAGERMTVAKDEEIEKVRLPSDEVEVRLAWRVGMLVFQGDSLETVLQEVSRYTNVRLEAEESIRGIQVEGFFKAGDIDGLLVSMLRNFNIDSQWIGEDQILLVPQRKE